MNYTYNLRLTTGANGQPVLESSYGTNNFAGHIVIAAKLQKAALR